MEKTKITTLVLEVIKDVLMSQDEKGKEKYGEYLDSVAFDSYDWQRMALEEMADGLKYVVMENAKLKVEVKRLEHIINELHEETEDEDEDEDEDEIENYYEFSFVYDKKGGKAKHFGYAESDEQLANLIQFYFRQYKGIDDLYIIKKDYEDRDRIFEMD